MGPVGQYANGRAVVRLLGAHASLDAYQLVVDVMRELHAGQLPGLSTNDHAPVGNAMVIERGECAAAACQAVVHQQPVKPARGFPYPMLTQSHGLTVGVKLLRFEPPGEVRRVPFDRIPGFIPRNVALLGSGMLEHACPLRGCGT
ncbi:hypothetical protein D3C79_891270 [compost metagenome]